MREKHSTTTKAEASPEAKESPGSLVENSSSPKKHQGNAADSRDALLALIANEKVMSLIQAWEENEKTKVENKTEKKMSSILSWENSKKAALEAELRKIQEKLEEKKAECGEKMKNKIAMIHKEAEERRAMAEARRKVELLKVDDRASEYRSSGHLPKRRFGCCSS
ncbi:remorin 1.4-like [Zingiber officinale]|uniref:remorin 1.4-like n=1 Tax=Zingiber officinale TaxID=94328 RepID=UPI001C4BAD69|nr:remorin 1.4-like [Zingiber officinale]